MSETNGKTQTEGMKTLKNILKRMEKNSRRINQYASKLSNRKSDFETDEAQAKVIKELAQANEDLSKEYRALDRRVRYTNLMTPVDLEGKTYTLHDLLLFKDKLNKLILDTFLAMNDNHAKSEVGIRTPLPEGVTIDTLYREEDKMQKMREWEDLFEKIEQRLETINATTPLLEVPALSE